MIVNHGCFAVLSFIGDAAAITFVTMWVLVCVKHWACFSPAVREDRSPGGKHRHKRQRTDDIIAIAAGETLTSGGDGQDFQDPLLERLVAAQPDRIPKAEGESVGVSVWAHRAVPL